MTNQPYRLSRIAAAVAALTVAALTTPAFRASAQEQRGSIIVSYEAPKSPAVQQAHEMATGARGLEMMQVIFSPFRLPEDLYMKAVNCDGVPNAYFFREDDKPTIRICYELLTTMYGMIPKKPTAEGITPREAFTGMLLFAIAQFMACVDYHRSFTGFLWLSCGWFTFRPNHKQSLPRTQRGWRARSLCRLLAGASGAESNVVLPQAFGSGATLVLKKSSVS